VYVGLLVGGWLACAAAAALVAERSPRRGPGPAWYLEFGPFGLLLTAFRVHADRVLLSRPPAPGALAVGIDVPCEALVEGTWRPGRLLSFRTLDEHWQGYVRLVGGTRESPTWFARKDLRPLPPAG
jgi:hypothetical protein